MLNLLPLEILEILFLYVNVEDLINVWNVVGIEGSNQFWEKVCKQQGFKKAPFENKCWKKVFERNVNWNTKCFTKREYIFNHYGLLDPNISSNSCPKNVLLGQNLVLGGAKEVIVLNVSESPTVTKTLPSKCFNSGGTKILTLSSSQATIHSIVENQICKIHTLTWTFTNLYAITDDFLVSFDEQTSSVKVLILKNFEEYTAKLLSKGLKLFSLVVVRNHLNILVLEETQYKMKNFNLVEKLWLPDIVIFQGAALIMVPKIKVNSHFIVTWANLLEQPSTTPLKIFNKSGVLLKSISHINNTTLERLSSSRPLENILWLLLKGEYVLFSTSDTSFCVWTLRNPHVCDEIKKESNCYNGQQVVSSSLLVLSYLHGFKVFNFKNSMYLFEIIFDAPYTTHTAGNTAFFANEYFYLLLQERVTENDKESDSAKNSLFVDKLKSTLTISGTENTAETLSKRKHALCIYDFRGSNF